MAKNLSREFATMSDDERRRFALQEEEGDSTTSRPSSSSTILGTKKTWRTLRQSQQEVADPERRDGVSAELDEEQHEQRGRGHSGGRSGRGRPVKRAGFRNAREADCWRLQACARCGQFGASRLSGRISCAAKPC